MGARRTVLALVEKNFRIERRPPLRRESIALSGLRSGQCPAEVAFAQGSRNKRLDFLE